MTLLICPVRPGETNEELRFALRSWDDNLLLPTGLVLMTVGDRPPWLRPDIHVSGNLHKRNERANVWDNVQIGAEHAVNAGQDEVVMMNDDFYCIRPVTEIHPVKRNQTLAEHIGMYTQYHGMWWCRSLALTASHLLAGGWVHPDSYEVHRPLLCKPEGLLSAMATWTEPLSGDIPQWRTLYGVINEVEAEPVEDVKYGHPDSDTSGPWASTSDISWRKYGHQLMRRFQRPSRWEG